MVDQYSALTALSNQALAAEQSMQDALLYQQQAAEYEAQMRAQAEAYHQQQMQALAQQQAAVQQQAAQDALFQQQQTQQAQTTAPTTGNEWADKFIADSGNVRYGQHTIGADTATLWNRRGLDQWLQQQRTANGWNDLQTEQVRKQVMDGVTRSTGKNIFQTEERGFWGGVGDAVNRAVDGAVGSLAELGAAANASAYALEKKGGVVGKALTFSNPVAVMERAWEGVGLGDGKMNWDKQLVDGVAAAREAFGKLRSDESRDAELARSTANGVAEALEAMADNPLALTDELAYMGGMLFGAKGIGAGVKAAGAAQTRAGLATAVARGGNVAEGSFAATQAARLGIADDIIKAGSQHIGTTTGVLNAAARNAGYARAGVGVGLQRTGTAIANTSPLVNAALAEGAGQFNDVLRTDGAWNEAANSYTDDALTTAAVSGALTGGITYGLGRAFGTLEGSVSRAVTGRAAARAEASTLGQAIKTDGGTDIDFAIKAVVSDIAEHGSSRATTALLQQVENTLNNAANRQALIKALKPDSAVRNVVSGAKPIIGSMLAEGFEEGLVAAIGNVAIQGMDNNGNFDAKRIDWGQVADKMGAAATVGAALGVVGGAVNMANQTKEAVATVDDTIAAHRERLAEAQQQNADTAFAEAAEENRYVDALMAQQSQREVPTVPTGRVILEDVTTPEMVEEIRMAAVDTRAREEVVAAEEAALQRIAANRKDVTGMNTLSRVARTAKGFGAVQQHIRDMDNVPQSVRANIELLAKMEAATQVLQSPNISDLDYFRTVEALDTLNSVATRRNRLDKTRAWVAKRLLNQAPDPAIERNLRDTANAPKASGMKSTQALLDKLGVTGTIRKEVVSVLKGVKGTNARSAVNDYIEARLARQEDPDGTGLMVRTLDDDMYRDIAHAELTAYHQRNGDDEAAATAAEQLDALDNALDKAEAALTRRTTDATQEVVAEETKKLTNSGSSIDSDTTAAQDDVAAAMAQMELRFSRSAPVEFDWEEGDRVMWAQMRREFAERDRPQNMQRGYQTAKAQGKTELTFEQWQAVRTPSFKAWFGDWENDPANASKVINPRTGEPLVVYHGRSGDFNAFDRAAAPVSGASTNVGFFFADSPDVAASYASVSAEYTPQEKVRGQLYDENDRLVADLGVFDSDDALYAHLQTRAATGEYIDWEGVVVSRFYPPVPLEMRNLVPAFLNIRSPSSTDFAGATWNDLRDLDGRHTTDTLAQAAEAQGRDGFIAYNVRDTKFDSASKTTATIYTAFDPNQIKSATDNSGAFDTADNNIYRSVWSKATFAEQALAVQQQTRLRAEKALRHAFGKQILNHIVFVSPNSLPPHERNTNAFISDGDPNTVYVVLNPDRSDNQFVHFVAHELLHSHMTVNVRGKTTRWGDYQQMMDTFAEVPYVQELMGAMKTAYPTLDHYRLAEEALAEIHAARTSPDGWLELANTWGIDTEPPAALRSKAKNGFMDKIIQFFKRMVAQWRGDTRTTTDEELAAFLRTVNRGVPTEARGMKTPVEASALRDRLRIEAAQQRLDYYRQMAEDRDPDFANRTAEQRDQAMQRLAEQAGDTISLNEMVAIRASVSPETPLTTADTVAIWESGKAAGLREAEQQAAKAAAQQVPPSHLAAAQREFAMRNVRQIAIYPKRAEGADYDSDILDNYVGIIALVGRGKEAVVQVKMHDPDNNVTGVVYEQKTTEDLDDDMYRAWQWLNERYPDTYTRPSGSTYSREVAEYLTPSEIVVLNRAQQMGLTSPTVRRWTNWLRERLPQQWIPVLDKFLDFLSMQRVRWVDSYTPMREVEAMFEQATGRVSTVVTRMLRDMGEGTAFLHRNFSAGGGKQSLRDRSERVAQAIMDNKLSKAQVNKFIYGLEEAVRYNLMLNSPKERGLWAEDADGKRYLVGRTDGGKATSVTGFNFQDLNTLDPKKGAADLGGKRFMAALAQMNPEQRLAVGRVVAEIAETGRVIAELQLERGIISQEEHAMRMERGKHELDVAFPELAQQGVNFGGFFITMRDDDSSPFTIAESRGRTSAVEDVLANTAAKWEADVKTAFRNNEMVQFALLVMTMPNKHFVVEPVEATNNPDDPTAHPVWVESSKGAKAHMVVYINGTPVKLVAKSKQAAAMMEAGQPPAVIAKLGSLNHFFNQFKTALNPTYPLFGLLRDFGTGYFNAQGAIGAHWLATHDAPKVGTQMTAYALRYLFKPDSGNLFYGTWRGEQEDPWAKAYQQLGAGMLFGDDLNTGAFANINSNPLVGGKVNRSVDVLQRGVATTTNTARRVAETLSYPPETAMRLGAFRAYTEHLFGKQLPPNPSAEQLITLFDQVKNPQNRDMAAAIIMGTKNLTSNFQQHGTDSVVRNLFSFHNAVMQGTFSTLPQILSTEHGRKSMAILFAGALAVAAASLAGDEEDELGNAKYFQTINRHRNLVFGETLQVPIPDEAGFIKALADNIVGVVMGKRNIVDASVDQFEVMGGMLTANQWGDTDNAFTNLLFAVSPTMVQPFVAMSSGHDIFGRKLVADHAYDENGKRVPFAADVERTTHRASTAGTGIAEFLYGATAGGIDMTGDEVDTIGRAYLGGLYGSFARSSTATMQQGDGVLPTVGSELFRSTKPIRIDNRADETWQVMGEKLGISTRHAGGMLDVLGAQDNAAVGEAATLYAKADEESRKVKSDMGYTYRELNDLISKAEAEGRYQDARDYRADMRSIRVNRDNVRRDAMAELNMLGIQ